MSDFPVLTTERLVLRVPVPTDIDAYAANWSDPDFVRYLGGRPLSLEESWLKLLRYVGSWAMLGYGFWLVFDRASGRLIGDCGFHELKRDTVPTYAGEPEAGWGIIPPFQGRGLAREAVTAALAWGDRSIDAPRTVCIVSPANAPSIAVATRFGYAPQADLAYKGGTMRLFARPRPAA